MTSGHILPDSYIHPVATSYRGSRTATGRIFYLFLWAFIFSIPCGEEVRIGGLLLVNLLGMAAIGMAALHLAATWQIRRLSPLHQWMGAFVAWACLSLFWTLDRDSTAARVGTYLQLLVLVWLIWQAAPGRQRVSGLLQAYVLGAFVTSLRALWNFATGETAASIRLAEGHRAWDEGRYTVAGMNENDLGLILALSIPMVLYLLSRRKGPLYAVFGWVHLAACVIAILLTGSRGAMISMSAGALMLPLGFFRLPRWQKLPVIGACVAAAVGAASLVPQETWRRLLSIGESVSQGTLTHRTVIWSAGLEAFRDHALVGVGAGAYGSAIYQAVDIAYVAHNTFLSVLVELGIIGILVFFLFLAALCNNVLRMPRLERRLWTVLLLTWGVGVSTLTWEYRKPTWVLFGILVAHIHSRDWARQR